MPVSERTKARQARANQGGGAVFPAEKPDRTHRVLNYPGLEYFWEKLKRGGIGGNLPEDMAAALAALAAAYQGEADHLSGFAVDGNGHFVANSASAAEGGHVSLRLDERGHLVGEYDAGLVLHSTVINDGHLFLEYNRQSGNRVLLWENPAHDADFTGLDPFYMNWNEYDELHIAYGGTAGVNSYSILVVDLRPLAIVPTVTNGGIFQIEQHAVSGTTLYHYRRQVELGYASEEYVQPDDENEALMYTQLQDPYIYISGNVGRNGAAASVNYQSYCVPHYIYGVKY